MINRDLQDFLKSFDDNEQVDVWVKIGDKELSEPNMATITLDEIFDLQDDLDEISLDGDNFLQIFEFTDNLLNELESRLQLSENFINEMDEVRRKLQSGDRSDFVKVDVDLSFNFRDCLNDYHVARTMRDLDIAQKNIKLCVKHFLGDVDVDIRNDILFIKQRDNISCSISIISDLLGIPSGYINDKQWQDGVWSIDLKEV